VTFRQLPSLSPARKEFLVSFSKPIGKHLLIVSLIAMNITYLFGAGASANALQPVSGMKESMLSLANELAEFLPAKLNPPAWDTLPEGVKDRTKDLEKIIADIQWVIAESRHHATVDTLAKRFYLLEKWDELKQLKQVLLIYFTLRQLSVFNVNVLQNNPAPPERIVDGRYDSFVAAYARKGASGPELPGNLKAISWNYDLQPELALKRYFPMNVEDLQEKLQIQPNKKTQISSDTDGFDMGRFGLVKLNGNAFWGKLSTPGCTTKNSLFDRHYDDNRPLDVLVQVLHEYHELRLDRQTLNQALAYFNFAWESDEHFKDKYPGFDRNLQTAVEIAQNTQVLVIIGYSFPIFNLETDRTIFNNMLQLEKVYIQDLNPEQVKSTMINGLPIFQRGTTINQKAKWQDERGFQLSREANQFLIPT
jgi:hypothetical protein